MMTQSEGAAFERGKDDGRTVSRKAQIAQLLRQAILSEKVNKGQQLESEAAMARQFGVSTSVIRSALELLRNEGWVMTQHGIGTVVIRGADREVVPLHPGEEADSRMPSPSERRELKMAEGVPVTVIKHADGSETPYDSTRFRVKWEPN